MSAANINEKLIDQIEQVELSDRLQSWKEAVKKAPYKMYVDRQKYATESWLATEGEDLEIRRAKLFQHVVENIEINILEYDTIAGHITPGVIGAYTCIDLIGDYLDGLWDEDHKINLTETTESDVQEDDLSILRHSARVFSGKTAVDMAERAWFELVGDWNTQAEIARLKDPTLRLGNFSNSTNTFNFEKLLRVGVRGYIEEAQAHIDEFVANKESDMTKVYFWKSAIIVSEAIITLAHRYAALARELAEKETCEKRKGELIAMAEACEHVPEYPARSFQEALQAMSILGIGKGIEHPKHNYPQWGRGDQYLYPYFMNDIEKGVITVDKAADLLAELIGRWGKQINIASSVIEKQTHQIAFGINGINLGGAKPDGEEGSNELTYLFLHVIGLLHQSSPTVILRWHPDTPDLIMKKAIKTNMITAGGIPLYENDLNVIKHYVADGVPLEEARDWVSLGCVWPALPFRNEYKAGNVATSAAAVVQMTLHDGVAITGKQLGIKTGDPRNFKTFDEFYDAFKAQYKFLIHRCLWMLEVARDTMWKYIRLPYLSTMSLPSCMDYGEDTLIPDPRRTQCGLTDRAIIDAADSLFAIKKLVYDDKKLTMAELLDALDSNFEGERGAEIQKMCLDVPHFGNDVEEVDLFTRDLSKFSESTVRSWDSREFESYRSIREGLSWHYAAGLGVGALPNGRKALEPLNDGSASPQRGMDKNGPTAVLRSQLTANFTDHTVVAALNQKFPRSMFKNEADVDKLAAYVRAFFMSGGGHIQFNIVDAAELKEAKVNPEEYQDLIVRIGGFSAYFVQLSNQVQDDVIMRSEHTF